MWYITVFDCYGCWLFVEKGLQAAGLASMETVDSRQFKQRRLYYIHSSSSTCITCFESGTVQMRYALDVLIILYYIIVSDDKILFHIHVVVFFMLALVLGKYFYY